MDGADEIDRAGVGGPPPVPPALLRLIVPALLLTAALVALGGQMMRRGPDAVVGSDLVGFALDPPRAAPAFALTDHTGVTTSLGAARGKAMLLFFGFTSCPDVCPTTLLTIARALQELDADAERVVPLFVSVDPERDSLTVLANYVAGYHPRIVGATADLPTLEAMAADYGVGFQKVFAENAEPTSGNYTMDHTATIFLIDPAGRLRAAFIDPTPADLAHDLRVVLAR